MKILCLTEHENDCYKVLKNAKECVSQHDALLYKTDKYTEFLVENIGLNSPEITRTFECQVFHILFVLLFIYYAFMQFIFETKENYYKKLLTACKIFMQCMANVIYNHFYLELLN